jgi:hypothetical protein
MQKASQKYRFHLSGKQLYHKHIVVLIKYTDILDYKLYKEQDVDGERVNWLNIKWIQVRKDKEIKEYSIFVNYGF